MQYLLIQVLQIEMELDKWQEEFYKLMIEIEMELSIVLKLFL